MQTNGGAVTIYEMMEMLTKNDALFLDFDGTLVDIATVPDAIIIPPGFGGLLEDLIGFLDGAVCIVTGREVGDIIKYLPGKIDVAAEHGAVLRVKGLSTPPGARWPRAWEASLHAAETRLAGLVVERKRCGVALHYRQNPGLEPQLRSLAARLCRETEQKYLPVVSQMTIELRRPAVNKGHAIRKVMGLERFRGRRAIFAADDRSDKAGFSEVRKMGGMALHVGRDFGGSTEKVREWLSQVQEKNAA